MWLPFPSQTSLIPSFVAFVENLSARFFSRPFTSSLSYGIVDIPDFSGS